MTQKKRGLGLILFLGLDQSTVDAVLNTGQSPQDSTRFKGTTGLINFLSKKSFRIHFNHEHVLTNSN